MLINEFLESVERKTNLLVEERGLAAIPNRKIVNKILEFCQIKTNQIKNGETLSFTIPEQITKRIDIVNVLKINVNITDATADNSLNGSGRVTLDRTIGFVNNKIDYAEITINGYSYNGILYDRTILSSLYHELNHLYDFWNDLKKTGSLSRSAKSVAKAGEIKDCNVTGNNVVDKFIHDIIYRLFSETELNALIANTYGDLQSIGSRRENFQEDIKKTKPYMVYFVIKDNLSALRKSMSSSDERIDDLKKYLEGNGIMLNPYGNSKNDYLKEFFRKTAYLLKKLYKGIGRVASLYYDTNEFRKPNVNEKITIK